MNDSQKPKVTLEAVPFVTAGALLSLDIESLRDLERQADKAVYDAGTRLEWIRGIIAKKLNDEGAANGSGA